MKHKNEVFRCFQDFYAYVKNQFHTQVQVIRTDTEYVNKEFGAFLSAEGILHQTSCPDTPPQNGVAERKKPSYFGGCSVADVHNECAKIHME
jgi:hypothetical protein